MRNVQKTIKNAKINEKYDISTGELEQFKRKYDADNNLFELMAGLFEYGYIMGMRAANAEQKKKATDGNQQLSK